MKLKYIQFIAILTLIPCLSMGQDSLNVIRLSTLYNYNNAGNRLRIYDDHLFLSQRSNGLKIIDISNPLQASEISSVAEGYRVYDVAIKDSMCFAATSDSGVLCISISDISNPSITGSTYISGMSLNCQIEDDFLYLCNTDIALRILNIENPYDIIEVGYYHVLYTIKVSIKNQKAFIGSLFDRLTIVDVSRPESPELLSTLVNAGNTVDYWDDLLFVAGSDRLNIYDILDPIHPVLISSYEIPGYSIDVKISGNYAYIANGDNGLRILDITDLENITEVGFYDTPGSAQYLDIDDSGYVYLTDYTNLGIYRFTPRQGVSPETPPSPSTPLLLSAYPNPFNSLLRIEYATSGDAYPTRLAVFGLDGKLVANLADIYPPFNSPPASKRGKGTFVWNADGFPAGSYFVRLDAGGIVRTERIMLVK